VFADGGQLLHLSLDIIYAIAAAGNITRAGTSRRLDSFQTCSRSCWIQILYHDHITPHLFARRKKEWPRHTPDVSTARQSVNADNARVRHGKRDPLRRGPRRAEKILTLVIWPCCSTSPPAMCDIHRGVSISTTHRNTSIGVTSAVKTFTAIAPVPGMVSCCQRDSLHLSVPSGRTAEDWSAPYIHLGQFYSASS
jgi:hypothetical protein